MAVYERALERRRHLPTLATGGRGFWARQQVLDLRAYLAALANPRDERALLGAARLAAVGARSSDALALLAGARAPRRARCSGDDLRGGAPLPSARRPTTRARLARFARARSPPSAQAAPRARPATSCSSAPSPRPATTCTCSACPAARAGWPTSASCMRLAARLRGAPTARDLRAFVDRATAELEAEAREPEAPVELGELTPCG